MLDAIRYNAVVVLFTIMVVVVVLECVCALAREWRKVRELGK